MKVGFHGFYPSDSTLVSPEKSAGRAALISAVLVVVDIGLTSGDGLAGGCGGGTVGRGVVVNEVVADMTGGAIVTSV